ncbi:MAG: acyltransferase [Chloroflexi bacterium]|nr:acyltransferase [Chloroflexota bacterium]
MVRRLLLLNGLAVVGAVLNHTTGWGFTAMFWWVHRYLPVEPPNFDQMGSAGYYLLLGLQQAIMFAVPAFLFVSGYFIAFATGRQDLKGSWRLIRSRIIYLLVPYLVWSLLVFAADFVEGKRQTVAGYAEMLVMGRTTPAYYFIPLLIQLYLLSPLLVRAAKRYPRALLAGTLIVQLGVRTLVYLDTWGFDLGAAAPLMELTGSWFFPGHLFWFSAGVVVGLNPVVFQRIAVGGRKLFLAGASFLLPLGVLEWQQILAGAEQPWIPIRETLLDSLYAALFILAFMGYESARIPFSQGLEKLAGKAFGVYLVHSPALQFGARAIYFVAPWLLGNVLLLQAVLFAIGVGVPLLVMGVADLNWSPVRRSYRYLFG